VQCKAQQNKAQQRTSQQQAQQHKVQRCAAQHSSQHSTAAGNELIQNQLGRFRAQASGMHSFGEKAQS